mgnify:FL=1
MGVNIKMNKITTEIALKRINDKIKETNTTLYVVNFEYVKKKSIIYMKCKVCGKEVERDYWRFIHAGGKCECQYKYRRWTEERCIELIKNNDYNDEYEFVNFNTGANITIKHNICNHEFTRASWNIKDNGLKCPSCYPLDSAGELNIENYLKSKNILYQKQKRFKGCKNKKTLPFDFYLPQYNCCIEFDGEQHFKPVEHLGGEKHYNNTVINDEIKNEFCRKNNILLLRVPFYKINDVNDIIENFLNNIS